VVNQYNIQSDYWYTVSDAMACYIWYNDEGPWQMDILIVYLTVLNMMHLPITV